MISLETARRLEEAGWHFDKYEYTWLPRLDHVLDEIERRGWAWRITHYPDRYLCEITPKDWDYTSHEFWAETAVEAAAEALLWILEQSGGNSEEGGN